MALFLLLSPRASQLFFCLSLMPVHFSWYGDRRASDAGWPYNFRHMEIEESGRDAGWPYFYHGMEIVELETYIVEADMAVFLFFTATGRTFLQQTEIEQPKTQFVVIDHEVYTPFPSSIYCHWPYILLKTGDRATRDTVRGYRSRGGNDIFSSHSCIGRTFFSFERW